MARRTTVSPGHSVSRDRRLPRYFSRVRGKSERSIGCDTSCAPASSQREEGGITSERSARRGALAKIGARLRELRLKRGLTLAEVAAPLGVTGACISQWETGRSFPRAEYLEPLAEALSSSLAYLFAGNEQGAADAATSPARKDHAELGAAEVIRRARRDIAHVLGLPVSQVRVEIANESIADSSRHDHRTNARDLIQS